MQIQELALKPKYVLPGDPSRLSVGQPVVEGGFVVEKITYHPLNCLYNKGKEVGKAGYAVSFVGIPERRFIFEDAVSSIQLAKETKTVIPELPE